MAARYVKRNHGTESPTNIITLDTESYEGKHKADDEASNHTLRLWTARRVRVEQGRGTRRRVAEGESAANWWRFLDAHSDAYRSTWVFGHGIGFDLIVLGFLHKLDRGEFTIQPLYRKDRDGNPTQEVSWQGRFIVDGPVTVIRCRTATKRYVFCDTLNYWPLKLAELGKALGIPKLRMPRQSDPNEKWLRYCHRDTEIVERAVLDLIQRWTEEDCGVFQPTAASLSHTSWRHTCDVLTPCGTAVDVLCDPLAQRSTLERRAYYGGKFSPFRLGHIDGPTWHVDVNSLYPKVMRDELYPRRFVRYGYGVDPRRLERETGAYGVVAEVLIQSRRDTYPVRIDGRQYHCRGQFRTALAGPELQRALVNGDVAGVGRVQYYSIAPLFRKWVDYWHGRKTLSDMRGDAGRADREFAKLILNSLSGKPAQSGRRWEDVPGYIPTKKWGEYTHALGGCDDPIRVVVERSENPGIHAAKAACRRVRCRGIGGNCQVLLTDSPPAHSFPAISAFISAHAREYIRSVIDAMPERSVYYLAVDGMLVSQEGYEWLLDNGWIDPNKLGRFRATGPYKRCRINGSNDYALDGKRTVAGWKGKAKRRPGVGKVLQVWTRLSTAIGSGPTNAVTVRTVHCTDFPTDPKGIVGPDGWVEPFRLSMDPEFTDEIPEEGWPSEVLDRLTEQSKT